MTTRPASRVRPAVTAESAAFWTGGAEGELRIYRCKSCQRYIHPWFGDAFPVPYVIAIVELEEDPEVRLTTQIVDCPVEDVRIGMPVEVEFEHHDDVWIPVFRPVAGSVA